MRMTSRLTERAPGQTEVAATRQVNITGILAQFGRGMIQDVSDQMFQKFTEAMRAELESAAPARAPGRRRPRRLPRWTRCLSARARRAGRPGARSDAPAFWAVAVALLLLIYWIWLR